MSKTNLKEFASFLESDLSPPVEVERQIFAKIRNRLNPSVPKSVSKLLILNAVGSVGTLALCPQYGLSFTESHVMHYLMQIHPAFCFFVCGMLWMIGGQLVSNFFLNWDERRVLSRYDWGMGFSFILFSVLAFACFGSLTLDLWLLFWTIGGLSVVGVFGMRTRLRMNRFRAAVSYHR